MSRGPTGLPQHQPKSSRGRSLLRHPLSSHEPEVRDWTLVESFPALIRSRMVLRTCDEVGSLVSWCGNNSVRRASYRGRLSSELNPQLEPLLPITSEKAISKYHKHQAQTASFLLFSSTELSLLRGRRPMRARPESIRRELSRSATPRLAASSCPVSHITPRSAFVFLRCMPSSIKQ